TLTLSPDLKNAGTPRIVRNGFLHVWLVVWRQEGKPAKIIGRVVQSDGTLGPLKILASKLDSAQQSFDVFYDANKYTYLLAFETAKGLQVQLFNGNLAKVGKTTLIEGGVSNTSPRLPFDSTGNHFFIFWISTKDGTPGKVLNFATLNP